MRDDQVLEGQHLCLGCFTVVIRRESDGGEVVTFWEPTERERAVLTSEYGRTWAGLQTWGARPGGLHRCPQSRLVARLMSAIREGRS